MKIFNRKDAICIALKMNKKKMNNSDAVSNQLNSVLSFLCDRYIPTLTETKDRVDIAFMLEGDDFVTNKITVLFTIYIK